jgi:hypothetical protein
MPAGSENEFYAFAMIAGMSVHVREPLILQERQSYLGRFQIF